MAEQAFVMDKPDLQAMMLDKVRESLLTSTGRYSKVYILPLRSPWKPALKAGGKAGLIVAGSLIAWNSNKTAKKRPITQSPVQGSESQSEPDKEHTVTSCNTCSEKQLES